MSEDVPHTVVNLSIESALLPEWFDAIQAIANRTCRRMAVIERPDAWIVKLEVPTDGLVGLNDALAQAWGRFVDQRRAEGRWESDS